MSLRRIMSAASVALIAMLAVPTSRARCELLSIPAGKALYYRLSDRDTGEEISRGKLWRGTDAARPVEWNEVTFPNGDRLISQCVQGNGPDKPATTRTAVMLNGAGVVDETDFDTFNPAYYPFLHRPLPEQAMESLQCFNARGLDFAALQRGEETSLFVWLNDVIYFRLYFRLLGKEKVSVPAGDFDTLKVRIRIDTATFFPNLPGWAAKVMGIFLPDIYVWVVPSGSGYEMVREISFPIGKHKHTVQELIGTVDAPAVAPGDLALLAAARRVAEQPKLAVDNTGTFTVGDLGGRVTISSGPAGSGRLLAVRTEFSDGLAQEGNSLVDTSASPKTRYMEQRTFAADGALVERKHLEFRPDSFPYQQDVELPNDLYAGSQTLADVIPGLRPDYGSETRFHVLGFEGVVNQLAMWQVGRDPSEVDGQDALHVKLKPIIDLPFYLKPVAYFLVPTFDAYLQGTPPYRLLEFTGPFGPPGSPPTHFVADAHIQSVKARESISAAPPARTGD